MSIDPENSYASSGGYKSATKYQDNQWFSAEAESPTTTAAPYLGTNSYNYGNYGYLDTGSMNGQTGYGAEDEDYENEPPLLEELGIRFDHIWSKTEAVVHPFRELQDNILEDADLAGPIFFCLLMGSLLLLSGKVHFGYIYGFSVFGCLGMNALLNLVSERGIDFWLTSSVLGYCLLPVICLSGVSVILRLQSLVGTVLSCIAIAWSTHAATRLFVAKMTLDPSAYYMLFAYPTMLLYSAFVLITIF